MAVVVRLLKIGFLVSLCGAFAACGPVGGNHSPESKDAHRGGGTVTNPSTEMYKPVALLWEDQNKDGMLWSAYTYQIIGNDVAESLLPGADDIAQFCPAYSTMSAPQKVNFWAYLVSVLAKYASSFDPTSQVLDFARGVDIITGSQSYAEGLLHLSYQDIRTYAFCAFDWNHDRNLPLKDIARSILNPVKNLDCGIKILATQIERQKRSPPAAVPTGLNSRMELLAIA